MNDNTNVPASFQSHVDLLQFFLTQRGPIVDRIDQVLNCQKKPVEHQQDHALLARQLKDCFFSSPQITAEQLRLRDQLEFAHWRSGFKPRNKPGNDIIDPAALALRAFHLWRQTRWPGQKGRLRYAHTLFNIYLLRCLALLTMRLWDPPGSDVGLRLQQVQQLLDELWRHGPADQHVLVRDARWLIAVAISPTTDDLSGYFEVARLVAETFSEQDQVETQKAWVQTAGGHLRSQLRHLSVQKGLPPDDRELVLLTRLSNALDIALLMQGLVTLMRAYQQALQQGDQAARLALAQAIGQGISPDPELFVNRTDLLGPYTMIEYLFMETDAAGHVSYTPGGQRHLQLLQQYKTLMAAVKPQLHADCQQLRAQADAYSPYGALYGFSSNLLELMAFKSVQLEADMRFSLEDVFTTGAQDKLAWVNAWRNLPHISREVIKQFEYPQQFADDVAARIEQALKPRAAGENARAEKCGRLYLVSNESTHSAKLEHIATLAPRYILSSDTQLLSAGQATAKDEQDLLHCRLEGEFLVSYPTDQGWVGISKDLLTDMLGEGQDLQLTAMPAAAQQVLLLMCPGISFVRS